MGFSMWMKLIDYMQRNEISDDTMAGLIGNCSASAVKKWKRLERSPDPDRIIRIQKVTGGKVGLKDWATEASAAS